MHIAQLPILSLHYSNFKNYWSSPIVKDVAIQLQMCAAQPSDLKHILATMVPTRAGQSYFVNVKAL
jgi:hypothetical protein